MANIPTYGEDAGTNPAPVNVMGVAVNANTGTPISRVLVQLGGRAMLTDHDGKFEFDQFTETWGVVQVMKPGYYFSVEAFYGGGGLRLTRSELSKPLTLRLYPEALLTGTITSPDGTPLFGLSITAMRSVFDENGHHWIPASTATTNVRGEFRLTVPPGEYRLRTYSTPRLDNSDVILPLIFPANSSGAGLGMLRLHPGEEQHFDLQPPEGRGYVVAVSLESSDSAGKGFPMFQLHTANGSSFPIGAIRMSAGGLYQFELPNGSYTLTASKYSPDGQQFAETRMTVAGHDVSGVVLRMQPVPMVPVEIHVDADASDNGSASAPASPNPNMLGLVLQRDSEEMNQGMVMVSPSQKDGAFGFRAAPGSYRLKARNTFGQWYVESATYGDSDLLGQDMLIAAGSGGIPIEITVNDRTGTLTGGVSVNGAPGHGWIYLTPSTPGAASVFLLQSNDYTGAYRATLPPGSYRAVAFEQRYSFDPDDPNALAPYASHVRTVDVHAGVGATLDLNAVTEAEIKP